MNSKDIKLLRESLGLSQKDFADVLGVSRGTVINYEKGSKIPDSKLSILNRLSKANIEHGVIGNDQDFVTTPLEQKFHVSDVHEKYIKSPGKEPDAHWYGVPNTMMVPMISHRAQAGFMAGWADESTTLEDFPKIPWEVDKEYKGRYVCFEVTGDSMDDESKEALVDGDVILCREVMQQHWQNKLHINQWDFVIAHKERGIVVKRINEHEVETGRLVLHSLNEMYDDYEVYLQDCIALFNVVDVKRSRRR